MTFYQLHLKYFSSFGAAFDAAPFIELIKSSTILSPPAVLISDSAPDRLFGNGIFTNELFK